MGIVQTRALRYWEEMGLDAGDKTQPVLPPLKSEKQQQGWSQGTCLQPRQSWVPI